MKELEKILENRTINSWVRCFDRSSRQMNKTHEADAELVRIEGNESSLLAITIDSVTEEISEGLYRDPFTMGWVAVMSNFSDLAAVGAEPIGIVLSICYDSRMGEEFQEGMAAGINAACKELGVFVFGGDMNAAQNVSLTGCAFGLVPEDRWMSRRGCCSGDGVFISGWAGSGNALGLVRLAGLPEEMFPEKNYRPLARVKEGRLIRAYASCCMDTSDGLLITLDQLLRINQKGFFIESSWEEILNPQVIDLCQKVGIPPWFMAAGIHGEFELVFTIPEEAISSFLKETAQMAFHPIRLGTVTDTPSLVIGLSSANRAEIDMAPLRNIWASDENDLKRFIQEYHFWGKKWGLE